MKLKKSICVLLAAILVLSALPVFGAESDSLITSVKDGDVFYNNLNEITLCIDVGYDVTIVIDGEKTTSFVSEGNDTVVLGKKLEAGTHTLTVVAVADDVLSQTVKFEVKYKGVDTTGIYANEAAILNREVSHSGGANAGTDENGNPVKLVRKAFEGIDSAPNGAVGFETTAPVASASGAQDIYVALYWSGKTLSGIVEVEYDIKIEGSMQFEFETSGRGWGNFGPNDMINRGMVAGKRAYVPGEWFHMKHVINIDSAKQDLYMNGEQLLSGAAVSNASGITTVKVQARAEASDVRSSVALDNFTLGTPVSASGIDSVSYKTADGYAALENAVLTEATDELLLTAADAKAGAANVTVFADGEIFETVKTAVDTDGSIEIKLSQELPPEADIKLVTQTGGYSMITQFKTAFSDFGISNFGFETQGGKCHVAKELLPGTELFAVLNVTNNTEDEKSGMVIMAIYDGARVVGLAAKNMTVESSNADGTVITAKVPDLEGDYTAECYMIDSFAKRNLLSKIYSLD